MSLSEKLAALAQLCGPAPDCIKVKRRWRLLGLVPIWLDDSEVWVIDDGDWWRVMLSAKSDPIIGADFRKDSGSSLVPDDFIAWSRDNDEWNLAQPATAMDIRQRIEAAINLAYVQHFADAA
jgi:hypothetical protein